MGFIPLALHVEKMEIEKANDMKLSLAWGRWSTSFKNLSLAENIQAMYFYQSNSECSLESMEFASIRIDTFKLPVDHVAYLHKDSLQSPRECCCYLLPECSWLSMSLTEIVCVSDF